MTKRGRPTLHGLKVITGERIRRSRIAMASGSSRKRIAEDIFKVSPRTFRRYLSTDHPRTKALKRAVEEGELLKGEPLATLICMLIDQRDQCMREAHQILASEVLPDGVTMYTSEGVSDEDMRTYDALRAQADELKNRLKKAVIDNDELKQYLKRDKRKQDDHFSVEIDSIQLNEITSDLGLTPLQTDDYLYKDQ